MNIADNIQLSYLVATRNKLPYLKNRLGKLLTEIKGDEEILVADGKSTDGTLEYLEQLKKENKISYLISESDVGVAHALNKIALKAQGTLIRFITDDDVFHYPTIQSCKEFMMSHTAIDILFTDGGIKDQNPLKPIKILDYHKYFETWLIDHKPFTATDLGVMFRRTSIPLLGLWNTSFPSPDAEFVFRVTSSHAKIAWCRGYSFINVSNEQSVSISKAKEIKEDMGKLNKFYMDKNPDLFIVEKLKILRNKIRGSSLFNQKSNKKNVSGSHTKMENWLELITIAENWLNEKYRVNKPTFIWSDK